MLIRRPPDIPTRDITDESLYLNRRAWLAATGAAMAALLPSPLAACAADRPADDEVTPYDKATTYNNFYEFGTGKDDPAKNAHTLRPKPWSVLVEGDVRKPGRYDLDVLLAGISTVERTYRHRCVEAWSMVIPWKGIQLRDLIAKLQPGTRDRKSVV